MPFLSCPVSRPLRPILRCACLLSAHSLILVPLLLVLVLATPALAQRATLLIPSKPSIESSLVTSTRAAATETGRKTVAREEKDEKKKESAKTSGREESTDRSADKKTGDKEAEGKKDTSPAPNQLPELVDAVNASIYASVAPQHIKEEVDLLIGGMEPFRNHGIAMDPPRLFTIYRFDRDLADPSQPAHREDRLGDIEEIRYLNQKAWGANVGLDRPGLYEFVIETQPWWEPYQAGYAQHIVKTMLPVYGEGWGWHLPLGLSFEIVPATRPFGLLAPALFTGKVLVNGKPVDSIPVRIFRINTENVQVPTPWHEEMELRTTENGLFSVVLNRPGWWCCAATQQGAPLKGPGGQPSPLYLSTLLWFYVDGQGQGN